MEKEKVYKTGRSSRAAKRSARDEQTVRQTYQTYSDGNTVRRVAYAEPAYERAPRKEPDKVLRARTRKNREATKSMTPGFVVFLAAASIALFFICTQYLQVQALATANSTTIESLESQLSDLNTANKYRQSAIEAMTDINDIYDIAVNELGMVYPSQDQIVAYDGSASEYVKQQDALGD